MLEGKPSERTVDLPQILEGRGKLRRCRTDIERRCAVGPRPDQIAIGMELGALADHHHQASGDVAVELKPGIVTAVIAQVLDIMIALDKPDAAGVGSNPLQDFVVLVRVGNRVIGEAGQRPTQTRDEFRAGGSLRRVDVNHPVLRPSVIRRRRDGRQNGHAADYGQRF